MPYSKGVFTRLAMSRRGLVSTLVRSDSPWRRRKTGAEEQSDELNHKAFEMLLDRTGAHCARVLLNEEVRGFKTSRR